MPQGQRTLPPMQDGGFSFLVQDCRLAEKILGTTGQSRDNPGLTFG